MTQWELTDDELITKAETDAELIIKAERVGMESLPLVHAADIGETLPGVHSQAASRAAFIALL
jgi:hypothetical protein